MTKNTDRLDRRIDAQYDRTSSLTGRIERLERAGRPFAAGGVIYPRLTVSDASALFAAAGGAGSTRPVVQTITPPVPTAHEVARLAIRFFGLEDQYRAAAGRAGLNSTQFIQDLQRADTLAKDGEAFDRLLPHADDCTHHHHATVTPIFSTGPGSGPTDGGAA